MAPPRRKPVLERGPVIGVPVTVGNLDSVADEIMRAVRERRGGYVCVADAHMTTVARRDPELAGIMARALIVSSDGMPLVWELKRQGLAAERVAGPDLMLYLRERAAAEDLPIFLYGGDPMIVQALIGALQSRFAKLTFAGCEAPPRLPERPPFDADTAARIESSGARIVFVGLGCPKQEYWIAAHAPRLSAVLIGVGAAFEYNAGLARRAPPWMRDRGLEWLYRLACNPRRLWKRYLTTIPLYLWYLALSRLSPDPPQDPR